MAITAPVSVMAAIAISSDASGRPWAVGCSQVVTAAVAIAPSALSTTATSARRTPTLRTRPTVRRRSG